MNHRPKSGMQDGISRRDFGRDTVLALAAVPAALIPPAAAVAPAAPAAAQQGQAATDLSAQARAEIEAKVQTILRRWGDRLNEEQRTRVQGTVTRHVRMLETIRAYPLENGDAPASVLKLIEHRSLPSGATGGTGKGSTAAGLKKQA